jgi:hypothetical protein
VDAAGSEGPRIGFLGATTESAEVARIEAFHQGLHEHGYAEGRNLIIEWRWAEGEFDQLPALAAELVHLEVALIVAGRSTSTGAAHRVTATVPIVMAQTNDPVGGGFVASLARPGGNITGLSTNAPEISGKRLQLLKEIVPDLDRLAILDNASTPGNAPALRETELAARDFGVQLHYRDVRRPEAIEGAFRELVEVGTDAPVHQGIRRWQNCWWPGRSLFREIMHGSIDSVVYGAHDGAAAQIGQRAPELRRVFCPGQLLGGSILCAPIARRRSMEAAMKIDRLHHGRLAALGLSLALTLGAASPALAQGDARSRCIAEAGRAGLLRGDLNPSNATFHPGTDGDDSNIFTPTAGRDVFCGFGGNDHISSFVLGPGDIFLGGTGNDVVQSLNGGTFNGGEGDDRVAGLNGGTFNGGEGDDVVSVPSGGTFNGGPGNDSCVFPIISTVCNP